MVTFLIWMKQDWCSEVQTAVPLLSKAKNVRGGKKSKDRVTLALCASKTGEKLPPLLIGKAEKPRCFNNINIKLLPMKIQAMLMKMTRKTLSPWPCLS